jgi:hypothetical protein
VSEDKLTEGIIENSLKKLKIQARKTRKKTASKILAVVVFMAVLILIGYYFPEFSAISVIAGVLGTLYVIFDAVPKFIRPLEPEYRAFRKIAEAIDLLEASNEEAHDKVKAAHKILNGRILLHIGWYTETNSIFARLLENIELIVLPAIEDLKIKKEDLGKTALAIGNMNPAKAKEVNDFLEKTYPKAIPEPKTAFLTEIRESTVGRILGSLVLGYGLIIVVCSLYVIVTDQNLPTFMKEKPDIIILGGLIASGITFWKTKKP